MWIWCISCCCIEAPSEAGWAGERTAGEAGWVVNRRAEEQNWRIVEHAQRKRQQNTGTTEQPAKQQRAGQSSYYSHQFNQSLGEFQYFISAEWLKLLYR